MTRHFYFILLAIAFVVTPLSADAGGPDSFGYTFADSTEPNGPDYQWVDISQTGESLLDKDSGNAMASVELVTPVVTYGSLSESLTVSRHGYLSTSEFDDGADFTNDCPLPAATSSGGGDRIYALHDNLAFGLAGSQVLYEYFPVSPHPHHPCGVHVITWRNMKHSDAALAGPVFSFQVLLFDNFDILIQFKPGNPETGSGSTTGIQNSSASSSNTAFDRSGLTYVCNSAGTLPGVSDAGLAVLFEPPYITVNSADDGFPSSTSETTFREAFDDASSGMQIRFDNSLSGETIDFDLILGPQVQTEGKHLAIDVPKNGLAEKVVFVNETIFIDEGDHLFVSNVSFQNAGFSGDRDVTMIVHDCDFSFKTIFRPLKLGAETFAYITDSRFIGNDGAISCSSGSSIFVRGCYFLANIPDPSSVEDDGGAIFASSSLLAVIDSTFISCEANLGGAIHAIGGDVSLLRSSFSNCAASSDGGAVFNFSAKLTIDSCSFSNNESGHFGGAVNSSDVLTVENSTFSENEAPDGGAIFISDGSATIDHCTVVGNSPNGIRLDIDVDFVAYGHCLFQENNGGGLNKGVTPYSGFVGIVQSTGYNLMDDTTFSLQTEPGPTDLTGTDALLGSFGSNGGPTKTYSLTAGSPAIDSGFSSIASPPGNDQRGFNRINNGVIDIGAIEFVSQQIVTTAIDEIADPGTGLSLREAIDAANPGTLITFDASLNGANIRLDNAGGGQGTELLIDEKDLTIDASGLSSGISIGGGNATRVFRVQDSSVNLVNLHIRNGSAAPGGGFFVFEGDFTMNGGSVSGCSSAVTGGGFWFVNSDVTLISVDILNNTSSASSGGGGAIDSLASDLFVRNCRISSNEALGGVGGAIFQPESGTLTMKRTSLSSNISGESGGAIYMEFGAQVDLENVTISGNEAGSTSSGNASGGALFTGGSNGSIRHCTIANNQSKTGAGVVLGNSTESSFAIGHTIFDGNSNPVSVNNISGGIGVVVSEGYNLCSDGTLADWQTSTDQIHRPAFLTPLGDFGGSQRLHALLAISPAIDGGDPAIENTPGLDGRSFGRIQDGDRNGTATIDIGAFEAIRPAIVSHLVDETSSDGKRSLREAMELTGNGGRIIFDPALSNGTIILSSSGGGLGSSLTVSGKSLQIDATALPRGIEISGGDESRVFGVDNSATLSLHAVSVRDGFSNTSNGGGIRVLGELLMTHGALEGNRALLGGAISVEANARAKLHNVTVSGNQAVTAGGGVILSEASARLVLEHVTVTDNDCNGPGAGGIALGEGRMTTYSSIIAENTNGGNFSIVDPNNYPVQIDSLGYNLNDDSFAPLLVAFAGFGDQANTAPGLLSLANSNGWSRAHQLSGASAALNAGDPAPAGLTIMDARGFLRVAGNGMDIGATETDGASQDSELGGGDGMPDWWEQRYGLITFQDDSAANLDGDSATNLEEFQNGTNPLVNDDLVVADPPVIIAAYLAADPNDPSGTNRVFRIEWKGTAGAHYLLLESADMMAWEDDSSLTASGGIDIADYHFNAPAPSEAKFFFRIAIDPANGDAGN